MPYTVTCLTYDGVARTVQQESPNVCPVYHYDKVGKYFLAVVTEANKYEKRGPDYYTAPAHSTPVAPPERELGKIQVFDEENQTWSQVDDLRGTYWSTDPASLGREVVITDPVSPLPVGITSVQPIPVDIATSNLAWSSDVESWTAEPKVQLTAEQKLANAGLSVEELKGLLGI